MKSSSDKPPTKKQSRTQYSDAFKAQAVRLWDTGDYESQAALGRHLKMKSPRILSTWLEEAASGKKIEGIAVLNKLETTKIEKFVEETIITVQDTLTQLDPRDRANYGLQLIDRLTELRKNLVILPGDWGDGTGAISNDDALKILSLIPEEAQGAFIEALKEAKKL